MYLPVVNCKLAGSNTIALVDSGASLSIVQKSIFDEIKTDPLIKELSGLATLNAITGHQLPIIGKYSIPITLGTQKYRHTFFVVDQNFNSTYSLIIGIDFLQKNKMIIDLNENLCKSHNLSIPIKDANSSKLFKINNTNYGKLTQKCTLKPNHTQMVEVTINTPMELGQKCKIISNLNNPKIKIIDLNSQTNSDNTKMKIEIQNTSREHLILNKHTKIIEIQKSDTKRDLGEIRRLRIKNLIPVCLN